MIPTKFLIKERKRKYKKSIMFVKEYCNRDKKRFVLLSTHQYGMVKENIEESIEFFMLTPNESRV